MVSSPNMLLELPLNQAPIIVLDTETTGLNPVTGDRIVELAAVRYDCDKSGNWQVKNSFSRLIYPGRRMAPGASRVNKIYDRDLRNKPSFSEIIGDFKAFISDALIVAHNANFDASFLGMEFYIHRFGRPEESSSQLRNPWLCTLQLARRHFHFGRNNLGQIANKLGVSYGEKAYPAHRALNDVHTTAAVFQKMSRLLTRSGISRVGDFLDAQGGPILAPTPTPVILPTPFGEALSGSQPLWIKYDGLYGQSERIIEPRYSTEAGRHKYLIAHCRRDNDQRTFRLDRIRSVEIVTS